MEIRQYIADAFTDRLFSGNQAAVCLPTEDLEAEIMQKIAVENKFSETAFAVRTPHGYNLRWFTPGGEIDLCGHATLAAAFIIMTETEPETDKIDFSTKSGILTVERKGGMFTMNFPQAAYRPTAITDLMTEALGVKPLEAYIGRDLMMVLPSDKDVRGLKPDTDKLRRLPGLIQSVTAKGTGCDCVSRIFAPKLSVAEDPVTGSTHCMIAPYWAGKLGKTTIDAFQASARSGRLLCDVRAGGRIDISGSCVLYCRARIYV